MIKTNLEIRTEHVLIVAAGMAVVYGAWRGYKNAGAIKDKALSTGGAVVNSVNPVSDKNLVYAGVNQIGKVVSGDKNFSLGSWIYDITHPEPLASNDSLLNQDYRTVTMQAQQGIGL